MPGDYSVIATPCQHFLSLRINEKKHFLKKCISSSCLSYMGASSRQLPTRYAGPVSTVLWLWNPLGPGVLCKIICEIQQTKGKWKIVRRSSTWPIWLPATLHQPEPGLWTCLPWGEAGKVVWLCDQEEKKIESVNSYPESWRSYNAKEGSRSLGSQSPHP